MKLFFVAVCVAVATADRLENTYLPPSSAQTAGGSGSFLNTPRVGSGGSHGGGASAGGAFSGGAAGGGAVSANAQIKTIRFDNENSGDGTYKFSYETENKISHDEAGQLKNAGSDNEINSVQGQFSYTGDDGQTYSISYVADENGFQPQGDHLPVAPPIPPEILKALEQNAADEAAGIVDDGSYRAEHQGEGGAGAGAGAGGAGGRGGAGGAAVANQYLSPKAGGAGGAAGGAGGYRY